MVGKKTTSLSEAFLKGIKTPIFTSQDVNPQKGLPKDAVVCVDGVGYSVQSVEIGHHVAMSTHSRLRADDRNLNSFLNGIERLRRVVFRAVHETGLVGCFQEVK